MTALLLLLALLLPWLAGAAALRPLRAGLGLTTAGWLGYGYFLGTVLLTLAATLAALLPGPGTTPITALYLAALALVTGLGGRRLAGRLRPADPVPLLPSLPGECWLLLLPLALIGLHLGFAAHELYWRPLYPWDAWQTWLYTAKAWFFSGGPADILSPAEWRAIPGNAGYTAQGHHYPWLLPVQSWWFASVLGTWQENRVTWPALPAAIALALALGGQAVAATGRRLAGPLVAWLLLSLPLLQTHVSLAGYADLWLAGFSGLGLVALVRGVLEAHRGQLLLGLAALALGPLVKHDAMIWLVCGLALLLVLRRPRLTTLALALGGALAVALLAARLLRFDLQLYPVFANYWRHLWLADSWHLLWYLLPAALVLALLPGSHTRPAARVLGLMLAGLLASQLFLFGATSAGAWAEDGTAVNRLLLQVSPLLVFALAVLVAGKSAGRSAQPPAAHWPRSAAALLAGSVGLAFLLGAWLLAGQGSGAAAAMTFRASQLRAVEGPLGHFGNRLLLPPAPLGHAILSTGPVRFQTQALDLASIDIDGSTGRKQTLFWRTEAKPGELFSRSLPAGARQLVLRGDSHWRGTIIEVGMVLYPDPDQPVTVQGFSFETASPGALLSLAFKDWFTPTYWSQASINRTQLGAPSALLSLPVLAGLWMLLTLLALRLAHGAPPPLTPLLGVALLAWLLLDLRWLHNSYRQAQATQAHYGAVSAEQRDALDLGDDAAILEFARQARAVLGPAPRRVLLIAADNSQRFALRRLKYALLPHAAHIHNGRLSPRLAVSVDAVIRLTDAARGEQAVDCPKLPGRIALKSAFSTPRGTLCKLPLPSRAEGRTLKEMTH